MDESHVDDLIENEKEWRRYIVKKLDKVETEQVKIKEEMAAFRLWGWGGRGLLAIFLGGFAAWVKVKLKLLGG